MKSVPLAGREGAGLFALVDDADFERTVAAGPWYLFRGPRMVVARAMIGTGRDRRLIALHRFILGLDKGDPAVTVRDRNGLNAQRANLRLATMTQSLANMAKHSAPTTSQYKGVSWLAARSVWQAHIQVRRRRRWLGYFTSEVDAAMAYDTAARQAFGEFARTNFSE